MWSTVIVNSPLRAVAMLTSRSINANAPTSNMLYQPQHARAASGDAVNDPGTVGVAMTAPAAAAAESAFAPADVASSRKLASSGGKKVQFVASSAEDDASSGGSAPPTGGRSFAMRAVQCRDDDDAPVAVKSVSVRRLRTDSDLETGSGGSDVW